MVSKASGKITLELFQQFIELQPPPQLAFLPLFNSEKIRSNRPKSRAKLPHAKNPLSIGFLPLFKSRKLRSYRPKTRLKIFRHNSEKLS